MTARAPARPPDAGGLLALRVTKRLLDGLTLGLLLAVSLAVALPWFLQALPIDLALAARSAVAFAVLYLGLAALANRLGRRRGLHAAVVGLAAAVIVYLGLLWHLAGGIQNPMLLLAFFLPVTASGAFLGRGHAVPLAVLAVGVVGLVMLVESPELPWYLLATGLPLEPLLRRLPALALLPRLPGPPPPAPALFVTLAAFAVLLLAAAVSAGWLGRGVRWLEGARLLAQGGAGPAEGLFRAAFRADPTPALLVLADGGRVAAASDSFLTRMLRHGEDLVGRGLFELVPFREPDRVREVLRAGQGELPLCAYRVGPEARVARVRVHPVTLEGTAYRAVRFEDRSDLADLDAALQQSDEAVVLIGPDERLLYANRAAAGLFGELYPGLESGALEAPGLPPRWWRGGAAAEDRPVTIGGATYGVSVTVAAPPGAGEAVHLVRLRPGAPGGRR